MNRVALVLLITLSSFSLLAGNKSNDTTYWKSKYESSLGFSQTTFTNWAAGGENTIASNFLLNIFKEYKKGKVSWSNYLGIAYGLSRQESYQNLRKIDDKINFVTKGGLYAWRNWDYTGLFEFKSQFAEGFNYPDDSNRISRFMAPGYFQLSIGLNYKPAVYFSSFFSPVGARLTVVNDPYLTHRIVGGTNIGAFGVFGDNNTLWQLGASLNAVFKKDLMKNVNLLSKLDLFSDYRNHPLNIIVWWENNFIMKVNRYISLNLSTMFISDPKTPYKAQDGSIYGSRAQFRETFSIGFAYSIIK